MRLEPERTAADGVTVESCNILSLKRFMHVAVNASSSEILVGLTTIGLTS